MQQGYVCSLGKQVLTIRAKLIQAGEVGELQNYFGSLEPSMADIPNHWKHSRAHDSCTNHWIGPESHLERETLSNNLMALLTYQ